MLKAFKTKLKVTEKDYPKQHAYLMKIAKACVWVRNWYIREALDRMKADGVTIFTPKEELKKYSPRTIAQASRISGVSPSDISVLLVYFGR